MSSTRKFPLSTSALSIGTLMFSLLFCFQATIAGAEEFSSFADRPDWVVDEKVPEPLEAHLRSVEGGKYYLLLDRQIRLEEDFKYHFSRTAVQVTNREGLEDTGQLSFVFDPSDETFQIHAVRVIRNDQVLDLSRDILFEAVRQEEELDSGIIDGDITVFGEVKNLQVGDIVVTEVSWQMKQNLWPGHLFNQFDTNWSVPVARYAYRFAIPLNKKVKIKYTGNEVKPKISEGEKYRHYTWAKDNPDILSPEKNVPSWYSTQSYFEISTMESWAEVVEWGMPHYALEGDLPESVLSFIKSSGLDDATKAEQITQTVRYVQDDIRYVGEETGLGSHIPRQPDIVAGRGYGDCKGKSLLLVAMLRYFEIPAWPALTDINTGYGLPKALPSVSAFDHVIVKLVYQGQPYFIDATYSLQGGSFPNIKQPDHGYVLTLASDTVEPEPIRLRKLDEVDYKAEETFSFEEVEGGTEIFLTVEAVRTGRQADRFRTNLARRSVAKLEKEYIKYYEDFYPGIELVSALQIEDERDANRIITSESYKVSADKVKSADILKKFTVNGDATANILYEITERNRKQPLYLPGPVNRQHTVVLKDSADDIEDFEPVTHSTEYIEYSLSSKPDGSDAIFVWSLRTTGHEIAPDQFTKYKEVYEDIDGWESIYWDFSNRNEDLAVTILKSLFGID